MFWLFLDFRPFEGISTIPNKYHKLQQILGSEFKTVTVVSITVSVKFLLPLTALCHNSGETKLFNKCIISKNHNYSLKFRKKSRTFEFALSECRCWTPEMMAVQLILDTQAQQDSAQEGVAYWNQFENHFDDENELHRDPHQDQAGVALDSLSLEAVKDHGLMHG